MVLNINLSDARRIVARAIHSHKILNNHVEKEELSPYIFNEIINKIVFVEGTIGKIIIKLRRTEKLSCYTAIRLTRLLVLTREH